MKKMQKCLKILKRLGKRFHKKVHWYDPVNPKIWITVLVIGFSFLAYSSTNAIGAILAENDTPTVVNVPPAPDNSGSQQPGGQSGQPGGQGQPGQYQPGPMEPQGQNQQNMGPQPGQQMGPSPEQQAQMTQQRLESMKKGMSGFIKEMARVKKNVASYEKKGVAIPEDLKAAIAQIDTVTEKINNATDPDELQNSMSDFQDSLDTIRDWMPKLPRLAQLPKIIKQADKEITRVEKAYTADAKKIARAKLDAADILAEFRTAIDNQKAVLAKIKDEVKTDPDAAMDSLSDDFFGTLDNMWENDKIIQTIVGLKSGLAQMQREQKQAEKTVASLKKKNIDTTDLEVLLVDTGTQIADLKSLAAAKPIDYDTIIIAVNDLMDTKQEFMDKVQELTGGDNGYQPKLAPLQNFQMNIPQGFDMGNNSGSSNNGGNQAPMMGNQPQNNGQMGPPQSCIINGVEMPGKCEDYQTR